MPETSVTELLLPFENFYGILKENGFPVTPLQVVHTNKIIAQYAGWLKNEGELCKYLTPVFSGNEDEQELFKKLFTKHFAVTPATFHPLPAAKPPLKQQVKKHWKKILFAYAVLAFIALLFIYRTISMRKPVYDPDLVDVLIADMNNGGTTVNKWTAFRLVANEQLNVGILTKQSDLPLPLQTAVLYDWGDGSEKSSLPQHIYLSPGEYKMKALVHVLNNGDTVKNVLMSRRVFVCPGYARINITVSKNAANVYLNESIVCKAVFSGSTNDRPAGLRWIVDSVYRGSGDSIKLSFTTRGSHAVSCMVTGEKKFDYCNAQKDISIDVTSRPVVNYDSTLVVDMGKAAPTPVSTTDIPFLARLYKILLAVFSLLALLFGFLWLKELQLAGSVKTAAMNHYKTISNALAGINKKEWLPLVNKNYLPATEHDTVEIAKQLRRRVKDNISYLHISKTIYRTIEHCGFFMPVKEERTRPSEYLLLIEETGSNSMQVKLFEYLAFLLKKHGLLVDIYYYRADTGRYYNFYESGGTSLEKLYNKHPNHIVFFLGSRQHLSAHATAAVTTKETVVLNQWRYKAVITAVSYTDWNLAERSILQNGIPVVPADMMGLVLLADIITEKENSINLKARLNLCKGVFYSSRGIDFQNTEQLFAYCSKIPGSIITTDQGEVSLFFEWVTAMAVYPSIRWEIMLALGKAIFEQYEKEKLLNYSALLAMVRISWVQEGKMPHPLRLALLKRISKETEILARETILQLLKEIPKSEIPANSSAFAEREIQQIINEYSLYASDPVYYSKYHLSKYVFKKLWENKQLNDTTLEEHLKGPAHTGNTFKNKSARAQTENIKISTEEFLRSSEREETVLGKVYLALLLISALVAAGSLFALRVLFVWDNYL